MTSLVVTSSYKLSWLAVLIECQLSWMYIRPLLIAVSIESKPNKNKTTASASGLCQGKTVIRFFFVLQKKKCVWPVSYFDVGLLIFSLWLPFFRFVYHAAELNSHQVTLWRKSMARRWTLLRTLLNSSKAEKRSPWKAIAETTEASGPLFPPSFLHASANQRIQTEQSHVRINMPNGQCAHWWKHRMLGCMQQGTVLCGTRAPWPYAIDSVSLEHNVHLQPVPPATSQVQQASATPWIAFRSLDFMPFRFSRALVLCAHKDRSRREEIWPRKIKPCSCWLLTPKAEPQMMSTFYLDCFNLLSRFTCLFLCFFVFLLWVVSPFVIECVLLASKWCMLHRRHCLKFCVWVCCFSPGSVH